jgi:DNA polymerase-3 subunit delta
MLYIYHGENSFDSWDALISDLDKKKKKFIVLEGKELTSTEEIFKDLNFISMFSNNDIDAIIIKRLSECKSKTVLKGLKSKLEEKISVDLYIWETVELGKFSSIMLLGKELGKVLHFKPMNAEIMKSFVKTELNNNKIEISPSILDSLLIKLPFDKFAIKNELEKIYILLSSNKKKVIELEDLNIVANYTVEHEIWDLTEAISKKDKVKSMELLNLILKKAEDFPLILAILTNQFEILYFIKSGIPDSIITSKLKVHPFVLEKNRYYARNFTIEQIKMLFFKLANLDFNIKKGRIDYRLGLNLLITTL